MMTLQILLGFFVVGTFGSIMLLKDGYVQHAKILFFQMTLAPIGLLLLMIIIIGMAPMSLR